MEDTRTISLKFQINKLILSLIPLNFYLMTSLSNGHLKYGNLINNLSF